MQHYRCKCGESKAFGSMGPAACARCEKCGSDLATGPKAHREPAPHEFVTRYDARTGAQFDVCDLCLTKRAEMSPEEAARGVTRDGGAGS